MSNRDISGSRWVLYHGTSTARLKNILKENRLRTSKPGDPKIALTTERSVAEYWACHSVLTDRHDHPDEESSGIILVLDGERLLAHNYDLTEFRDEIWGEGECDWENEIACWANIEPFSEFLMATESVTPDRYREIIDRGNAAFRPTTPSIAGFVLTVMADTIDKLVSGKVTPENADAVANAVRSLRATLDFAGP